MLIFFVSILVALSISFMCSVLEATVLSITPSQVATLEASHPRLGRIWKRFKDNIERPIAVILVLNTTAHTVGATIAGAHAETIFTFKGGVLAFSALLTYLMLQFTEILPKTLGVRYNVAVAPLIAAPLELLITILSPAIWFIQLVNRPFASSDETNTNTTMQEIAALVASAPLMDPHQSRMIRAASEIEKTWVRQIMTPRTEVMFLRMEDPLDEVLATMSRCPYTRLPLCKTSIDDILGMVHIKDLVKALKLSPGTAHGGKVADTEDASAVDEMRIIGHGTIDLNAIKREVLFLPEHINVLEALRRFQRARLHLAVVVDEYGATIGIVTLEDVIEEMVGDIKDEFDLFAADMLKQEGDAFRISGRFPLHDINHLVPGLNIDHTEEEADTVGGFVSQVLGHLPEIGEAIEVGPYKWTVTSADIRRVREVLLTPLESAENAKGEDS